MLKNWMLAEDGGGGSALMTGANPPSAPWYESLPPELKSEQMLRTVPDVPTLAKNYVNAERLIGTKRLPMPDVKWGENEWGTFWNQIGRPETPDKYTTPELKLENGLTLDSTKLGEAKSFFHKMGLTDKQSQGLLQYYSNVLNTQAKGVADTATASRDQAMNTLRQEFGDKVNTKIDLARGVLRKYGSDQLMQHLETAELGNNVEFIKALSKMGEAMLEDVSRGGSAGGGTLDLSDTTRAKSEIENLKLDPDFVQALSKREHVGHQAAVDKWTRLHRAAFPNTPDQG